VPSVVTALARHEPAICRNPTLVRDYLYVREVAAALEAVLESDVRGVVNIGSGTPVQLGEFTRRIAAQAGATELVRLETPPAGGSEPPVIAADITRLSTEVGWHPTLPLRTAIDETLAWWTERRRVQ
jgi:nucleoside-diphosphate-sugar epimerase